MPSLCTTCGFTIKLMTIIVCYTCFFYHIMPFCRIFFTRWQLNNIKNRFVQVKCFCFICVCASFSLSSFSLFILAAAAAGGGGAVVDFAENSCILSLYNAIHCIDVKTHTHTSYRVTASTAMAVTEQRLHKQTTANCSAHNQMICIFVQIQGKIAIIQRMIHKWHVNLTENIFSWYVRLVHVVFSISV